MSEKVWHGDYCLYVNHSQTTYDRGEIKSIAQNCPLGALGTEVCVNFANGGRCLWETELLSSYNYQFGTAVSPDGKYVFVQTWDKGVYCLDSRSGKTIWCSRSKKGVTSLFVNGDTLLCHRHGYALELLDIHTGEVLAEKRPAKGWGFTALDHRYIVCQVTARRWEIIDARTLETKKQFSHKLFTDGHEDYVVSGISLTEDGRIQVQGFTNVWDNTVSPPVMLPNPEFEHYLEFDITD